MNDYYTPTIPNPITAQGGASSPASGVDFNAIINTINNAISGATSIFGNQNQPQFQPARSPFAAIPPIVWYVVIGLVAFYVIKKAR